MKWTKLIEKVPEKNKDFAARRNGYYGELHIGPDFILFRNLHGTKELKYTDMQDTEWLDETESTPSEGKEAIEFAEWCADNYWVRDPFPNKYTGIVMWSKTTDSTEENVPDKTIKQLYSLFIEQKNKEK